MYAYALHFMELQKFRLTALIDSHVGNRGIHWKSQQKINLLTTDIRCTTSLPKQTQI